MGDVLVSNPDQRLAEELAALGTSYRVLAQSVARLQCLPLPPRDKLLALTRAANQMPVGIKSLHARYLVLIVAALLLPPADLDQEPEPADRPSPEIQVPPDPGRLLVEPLTAAPHGPTAAGVACAGRLAA
ncbi:MAG: hypothetical protein WCF04_15245 [Candidatus Nanopelagicales bacterium]